MSRSSQVLIFPNQIKTGSGVKAISTLRSVNRPPSEDESEKMFGAMMVVRHYPELSPVRWSYDRDGEVHEAVAYVDGEFIYACISTPFGVLSKTRCKLSFLDGPL